jgi:hypothetical protein
VRFARALSAVPKVSGVFPESVIVDEPKSMVLDVVTFEEMLVHVKL